MKTFTKWFNKKKTPQWAQIPGTSQVRNDNGGYVWAVDDWARLDRFLILGCEGGTFYATERKLTRENAEAVLRCIAVDGARVVARIVAVSDDGRAPKNDPALFALALAAKLGDEPTRRAAHAALPRVARIGTHLFHFAEYVKGLGGWGRGTMRAFARWYNDMDAGRLAVQAVKYQSRDGWSHRDVLRKAHPVASSAQHQAIYHWMVKGWDSVGEAPHPDRVLATIWAFERAKRMSTATRADVRALCDLIATYGLPHEAIPTEAKAWTEVWEAMLPGMGLTALIRNLGKMTEVGLFGMRSSAERFVVSRLNKAEALRAARVHPLAVLVALNTYAQGHGDKGKLKWMPRQTIVDALDAAFYKSFEALTPTGARTLLALDVSGSMTGPVIAGMAGITPRVGSAAMALVTAAVEPDHEIVAFTNGPFRSMHPGYPTGIEPLAISPRMRMDDVLKKVDGLPFGGTDCALPMLWASENKVPIDIFCVYTDSETWAGDIHPVQALNKYRQKMGIGAKLVVIGMTSNGFTIADPNDAGMLDVVGFDTATPSVIADFATQAGRAQA
ncbi:MAG TPA: TROVE domain-containing protein [Polyangia bacterium]|jgi:60 kDa SS-A/Ro ribonucleoprotein|nr:TROVE domain-containing protein [Polyangia bacterium]